MTRVYDMRDERHGYAVPRVEIRYPRADRAESSPTIVGVRTDAGVYSSNQWFATLADADDDIVARVRREAPPAPTRLYFRVRWSDGAEHASRADIDPTLGADAWEVRAGWLRAALRADASWLITGRDLPEAHPERPRLRAWGEDLLWRLRSDTAAEVDRWAHTRTPKGKRPPGIREIRVGQPGQAWMACKTLAEADRVVLAMPDNAAVAIAVTWDDDMRVLHVVGGAWIERDHKSPIASALVNYGVSMLIGAVPGARGGQDRQPWAHELVTRAVALGAQWDDEKAYNLDGNPRLSAGEVEQRNAADDFTPEVAPWRSGRSVLAGLPESPTLLPDPVAAAKDLIERVIAHAARVESNGQVDWTAPYVGAMVNYVTRALRTDLHRIDHDDAHIIHLRWRAAVVEFRQDRAPAASVSIRQRLTAVAADLATSRAQPGAVARAFCPWRRVYFNAGPDRRKRLEIDPWRE